MSNQRTLPTLGREQRLDRNGSAYVAAAGPKRAVAKMCKEEEGFK